MKLRLTGIICVLGVAVGAAAPASAEVHTVNQVGLTFVPADISVLPGDTINWIWESGIHTVTSGDPSPACTSDGRFDMPLTAGNPTATYVIPTDEAPGVILYHCTPHCAVGMEGTITVEAAAVPTMSEWGLAAMALLVLTAGSVVFRRRVA